MNERARQTQPVRTAADLGAAIRRARRSQHLTLAQLSGLSGLGVRFLSELERGKPTAQLGKALEIASLLGLGLAVDIGEVSD
ncbi:MAG: helix-turn-helix domain-containing protein [Wenzhouxiangella sp.]|jgi:transcriptional regulator with XRE-family HTH domain|nr:helix-turn-helix domain-containing protein [Wenzhouxiangella sp.]